MLLDEYPPGPCLIVADDTLTPVAILAVDWPWGLVEALTVFTLSDTPRVELVVPAWIRPTEGLGAVCPCGGSRDCAGCGGTGVFRGSQDAVIVYPLTPDGPEDCVAFTDAGPKPLNVVGGFVPRAFAVALDHRRSMEPMPLEMVLDAIGTMPDVKVRRM